MSSNKNINKTDVNESVERLADKDPTSEVMEVTPMTTASGVTQGKNHGIRPPEEEDNWVAPGRNADFTYLIRKNINLKELHETQNGYITKLDDIMEKEIFPKLLKN